MRKNWLNKRQQKKLSPMKKLLLILLLAMVGFAISAPLRKHKKELLLTCQGKETFSRDNPRAADVLCLREEMESLIKDGNFPVVIECDRDVAWLYLNDPMGRDYPEVDFESDYFEIIMDLFPLKINNHLKKDLEEGNQKFFETLGIEYSIENGEVISKIDYEKFEKFLFWKDIQRMSWVKADFCQLFLYVLILLKNGPLIKDHYYLLGILTLLKCSKDKSDSWKHWSKRKGFKSKECWDNCD